MSLFTAIESGWPPRSQVASTAFVAMSTVASNPDGSTKLLRVLTATSALAPTTATEVGSPSKVTVPTAFGAFGYTAACVCLPLGNYHNMNEKTGRTGRMVFVVRRTTYRNQDGQDVAIGDSSIVYRQV